MEMPIYWASCPAGNTEYFGVSLEVHRQPDRSSSCRRRVGVGHGEQEQLGKLRLAKTVRHCFAEQPPAKEFRLIKIEVEQAALVESLPLHHRHPFDRLLAARARRAGRARPSRGDACDD